MILPLALVLNVSLACSLTPDIERLTNNAARATGLEPQLLTALLWQESRFCHRTDGGGLTTSAAGALGIGQLMPATAARLEVDPADLAQNIHGAARYLRAQWDSFQDWTLALAAYNAGPGAVARWGGVPPYPETQRFVAAVLTGYAERVERGKASAPGHERAAGAVVGRRERRVATPVVYRR